jgi:hypothetical protein
MIFALLIPGLVFAGVNKQGDGKWTLSHASAYQKDVNNDDVLYDAAAPDSNMQFVVYTIDARGNSVSDDLEFWAYIDTASGGSNYQTLNESFSGGVTTNLVTGAVGFNDSTVVYVAIAQGGTVCIAETAAAADGAAIALVSGNSNASLGPTAAQAIGQKDLSAVTPFTAGARVYPMYKVGSMLMGLASLQKDSDSGLYAFPKGSPGMVMIDNSRNSDSGVTLLSVTGGYE